MALQSLKSFLPAGLRQLSAASAMQAQRWSASAAQPQPVHDPRDVTGDGIPDPGFTQIAEVLADKARSSEAGGWLWCSKDDFVIDAIRKMARANHGSLVVYDPRLLPADTVTSNSPALTSESIVGIFTERDYLLKVAVESRQSGSTRVGEVMTPKTHLHTVAPDQPVLKAMELMADHNVRHVPVMAADHKMMGMLSVRDVVRTLVKEQRDLAREHNAFIHGSY